MSDRKSLKIAFVSNSACSIYNFRIDVIKTLIADGHEILIITPYNAIVQKIEKMGFKAKEEKGMFNKDKGFIVFKNALIPEISDERMDYIVKTDRKSRREKDETTLYIIMQKDGENALSSMDAYNVGKAKGFANGLTPEIEEANLELQIKAQDNEVVKAEKKFRDLQDEKADLEKKLKKNTEDIEKQQKYIETQRTALDGLKSKRRVAVE